MKKVPLVLLLCSSFFLEKSLLVFFVLQFGEKSAIRLVRFLNSTVMVRVGGGWITLQEFLETNDPCRGTWCSNLVSIGRGYVKDKFFKICYKYIFIGKAQF